MFQVASIDRFGNVSKHRVPTKRLAARLAWTLRQLADARGETESLCPITISDVSIERTHRLYSRPY